MKPEPCKVCAREYEMRPNDICSNYLHWQAYVYRLEDVYQLEGKNSSKLPKFEAGDHVKIAEDHKSSNDYGVWFGKTGTIKLASIKEKHRSRSYWVKMDNSSAGIELKVYECDLEKIG